MQAPKKSPIFCSLGLRAAEGFGGLFQDPPEEPQVLLRQLGVDVPARLVGRNRVQLVPVAAGERQKSYAGVHGAVDERGSRLGV